MCSKPRALARSRFKSRPAISVAEFNYFFQKTYFFNCNVMTDQTTLYEAVGGEAGVRNLVGAFYRQMDGDPRFATIRAMHQGDLGEIEHKLFAYLSGWLGGPNLYIEQYGQPFMRRRHLPFAIGVAERDQWLLCMTRAMTEAGLDAATQRQLGAAFHNLADFMRNKEG